MTGLSINSQASSHGCFEHRADQVDPCSAEEPFCRGTTTHLGLHGPNHLDLPPPTARINISPRPCFLRGCHSLPAGHGGPGLFSPLLRAPLPHASASRRASALPPRPPWNPQHQDPGGLGTSISSIIPSHSSSGHISPCRAVPVSLSCCFHPVLSRTFPPFTLTGLVFCQSVCFWSSSVVVHSLTIQTTFICKAAAHFPSLTTQST